MSSLPSSETAEPTSTRRAMPGLLALVLLLLLALAFIGWRVMSHQPGPVVVNRLAFPVRIATTSVDTLLPSGSAITLQGAAGDDRVLRWVMAQPRTGGDMPVGAAVEGSTMLRDDVDTFRITPHVGGSAIFAPLITNQTGVPLTVTVNAGLQGAAECPCEIPPSARRMAIGYYQLFANSTVEVRDPAGRRATFRDLGAQVDPRSGVVGLQFNVGDLR